VALAARFSLPHPELDDFLFAEIGEEENGMPLSILSALSRLDVDPRVEAARLSDMPRDLAVRDLAKMISVFSIRQKQGHSDALALAESLLALLPQALNSGRATGTVEGGELRRSFRFFGRRFADLILLLAFVAMAALGIFAD
jgi:hypothetical protein